MEGIKAYLISVTAASLIHGIINTLVGKKGTTSTVIKLLAGLFLALTVIRPVVHLSIPELSGYIGSINTDAQLAVSQGEIMASEELAVIIKAQVEAYILDKAASLGVDMEVEVILSDGMPPLPAGVVLKGAVSPYAKSQLSRFIEEELGIPKGAQQWTG